MADNLQPGKFVSSLNAIAPRVWQMLQFLALITLVIYGGHLLLTGHDAAGTSLVVGAFALLKYEVGPRDQTN